MEPRDHGLEYEEDVRPQPRLTRPCAAWRRESRRLPVNRGEITTRSGRHQTSGGSWQRQNRPRRSATKPQSDGLLVLSLFRKPHGARFAGFPFQKPSRFQPFPDNAANDNSRWPIVLYSSTGEGFPLGIVKPDAHRRPCRLIHNSTRQTGIWSRTRFSPDQGFFAIHSRVNDYT